jgi:hypothetical protein
MQAAAPARLIDRYDPTTDPDSIRRRRMIEAAREDAEDAARERTIA